MVRSGCVSRRRRAGSPTMMLPSGSRLTTEGKRAAIRARNTLRLARLRDPCTRPGCSLSRDRFRRFVPYLARSTASRQVPFCTLTTRLRMYERRFSSSFIRAMHFLARCVIRVCVERCVPFSRRCLAARASTSLSFSPKFFSAACQGAASSAARSLPAAFASRSSSSDSFSSKTSSSSSGGACCLCLRLPCACPRCRADIRRARRDRAACDRRRSIRELRFSESSRSSRWHSQNCPDAASSSAAGTSARARPSQSTACAAVRRCAK